MPIFYHTAEKQCFQSLQCGAVHSRILSKTQGRAGGRLQHPKWYFQRFRALNTIRSTMCHGSGPSDYFAVYPYRPAKPRVPWIILNPTVQALDHELKKATSALVGRELRSQSR